MTSPVRRSSTQHFAALVAFAIVSLALGTGLVACADSERGTGPTASGAAASSLGAGAPAAAGTEPGCQHEKAGACPCGDTGSPTVACGKPAGEEHAGCGEEPATEGANDSVREKVDSSGRKLTLAGADLGEAPLLTVAQALSRSADSAAEPVQVEGKVTAMCQGKRAWFAIVGAEPNGDTLRVITAPAFLVPVGSIGRRVRVQGRVEQVQVSGRTAKHYADDHKLPVAGDGSQPVAQTVLRATAAEFYDL